MLLKSILSAAVDYTAEMDVLQFAREAKKNATANFPADSSTWTDEHWAIEDEWESTIPLLENPDCICTGIVTNNEGQNGWVSTLIRLDPPPRHPALPAEIVIHGCCSMHTPSEFVKLLRCSVGDRVEVRGVFYPPMSYIEHEDQARPGEYFKLKETSEFRKRGRYW